MLQWSCQRFGSPPAGDADDLHRLFFMMRRVFAVTWTSYPPRFRRKRMPHTGNQLRHSRSDCHAQDAPAQHQNHKQVEDNIQHTAQPQKPERPGRIAQPRSAPLPI